MPCAEELEISKEDNAGISAGNRLSRSREIAGALLSSVRYSRRSISPTCPSRKQRERDRRLERRSIIIPISVAWALLGRVHHAGGSCHALNGIGLRMQLWGDVVKFRYYTEYSYRTKI